LGRAGRRKPDHIHGKGRTRTEQALAAAPQSKRKAALETSNPFGPQPGQVSFLLALMQPPTPQTST